MILIEFMKNTLTIGFPIPKSTKKCEKVILTFFRPFDHCAALRWYVDYKVVDGCPSKNIGCSLSFNFARKSSIFDKFF